MQLVRITSAPVSKRSNYQLSTAPLLYPLHPASNCRFQKCRASLHFFIIIKTEPFITDIHISDRCMRFFRILLPCLSKPFFMKQHDALSPLTFRSLACQNRFFQLDLDLFSDILKSLPVFFDISSTFLFAASNSSSPYFSLISAPYLSSFPFTTRSLNA